MSMFDIRYFWLGGSVVTAAAAALAVALLSGAQSGPAAALRLSSPAFTNNQAIPKSNSCDGDNTSPVLRWDGVPPGTQSLALVLRDPDAPAGEFYHWLLYDLPASVSALPSGKYHAAKFPLGGLQGENGFGDLGYGGPCPPLGAPHHYIFTLFALNQASLGLPPGASSDDLTTAMQGKVLAQAKLVGLYRR
ncbi:MAG: YbhB/YbcL family Raf kinase inhibitor-like protein, partial [Terriglobales bacterium]